MQGAGFEPARRAGLVKPKCSTERELDTKEALRLFTRAGENPPSNDGIDKNQSAGGRI